MKKLDERGMTLLELLIASAIFTFLISSLAGTWGSFSRTMEYLNDRAYVDRESRVARAYLSSDLLLADHVTLGGPGVLRLHYRGQNSPVVKYQKSDGHLVRVEQKGGQSIGIARYLEQANFTLEPDGSVGASLSFKRGISRVHLNLYLSFPLTGQSV